MPNSPMHQGAEKRSRSVFVFVLRSLFPAFLTEFVTFGVRCRCAWNEQIRKAGSEEGRKGTVKVVGLPETVRCERQSNDGRPAPRGPAGGSWTDGLKIRPTKSDVKVVTSFDIQCHFFAPASREEGERQYPKLSSFASIAILRRGEVDFDRFRCAGGRMSKKMSKSESP